jgi:CheY-like chemotaxis protein
MKMKSLNILVVDDDHNFAHTLCAILQSEGYDCREAYSVEAARDMLMREEFDFVLSDVKMQDQSGLDLYDQVKDEFPNLPFILMTAYTSNEIIDEALKAGVLAAFQKPIDIKGILQYFAKLSQSLKGAVICEEREICDMLKRVLEDQRFSFTRYKDIKHFIHAGIVDYAIIFIDAHDYSDHFSDNIKTLLQHIPDNTIVIICDLKKTADIKGNYDHQLNLIVLPREKKVESKIKSIIQKQYIKQAKINIPQER